MTSPIFVLASASPARRRLLEKAGISPLICPSHFDESQIQVDHPRQLVETLAQCKAQVIVDQIRQGRSIKAVNSAFKQVIPTEKALVLGCDSVLVVAGEIHGKPIDKAEAITRWQKMRGHVGQLFTGHALIDVKTNHQQVQAKATQVHFASASDDEIKAYVATGEPMNCAGCFALEGKGGLFIEKLEGCHTNVIGLSLPLLRQMLHQLDYTVNDFWNFNPDHVFYTHQGDPQLD